MSPSRHLTSHVALYTCQTSHDAMLLVIPKPKTSTFILKCQLRKCTWNGLYSMKTRSIIQWHLQIMRCCRKGTAGCPETSEFTSCLCYYVRIYFLFKEAVSGWNIKLKWKRWGGKLLRSKLRNLSDGTDDKTKTIRSSHSPDRYLNRRLLRCEVYLR